MKKIYRTLGLIVVAILLQSTLGFANKTTVKITAPEKADAGSEVTIKIDITHKGNSKMHFTDLVVVKINGEEYKKWEYTKKERPEAENFSVEFTIKVDQELNIEAEGNCNMHGSTGVDKIKISLKE